MRNVTSKENVYNVKRIPIFIMDNVKNFALKILLNSKVYVIIKIVKLVKKNKINKNVLHVKNLLFYYKVIVVVLNI